MDGDRQVRLDGLLIGTEGLALLRNLYDGSDAQASRRLAEVRAILAADGAGAGAADSPTDSAVAGAAGEPIAESDPRARYAVWAASYDDPANPIVALEQPAVWDLLDRLPAGRALDPVRRWRL